MVNAPLLAQVIAKPALQAQSAQAALQTIIYLLQIYAKLVLLAAQAALLPVLAQDVHQVTIYQLQKPALLVL